MTNEITPEITSRVNRRRAIRTFASSLFFALTAFATLPVPATAAQADPGQPYAEPFVKLDKTRFAHGEDVFFWVGVRRTGEKMVPIPKEFWNTCRLTIVRPDGSRKTRPSGWPIDGPTGSTWQGGSGLGEKAVPGLYKLIFEFAGKKSAPVSFIVERIPIIPYIRAAFEFGPPSAADTPITLTVRNESDQTIVFPHRDGRNSKIWVHFNGLDEKWGIQLGYPPQKLSDVPLAPGRTDTLDFSFDFFTPEIAKRLPTITLKPGEIYRQPLSLQDAVAHARTISPLPPGRYDVLLGTNISMLVGAPGDKFASLSPVRLQVENHGTCVVLPARKDG